MKILAPNYTQTPNDLFDKWLPHLGHAELKVLLVIMRKTFGWHKTHDVISTSQLAQYTGMLEETVIKAARSLQKKGVIKREVIGDNGTQKTIYSLVVEEESNNSYPSVEPSRPLGLSPPVLTEAQKKDSLKETNQKKHHHQPPPEKKPEPPKLALSAVATLTRLIEFCKGLSLPFQASTLKTCAKRYGIENVVDSIRNYVNRTPAQQKKIQNPDAWLTSQTQNLVGTHDETT